MSAPKFTPGPWNWVIHDHSMASLGVLPDPGLGDPLVLSIGPCRACADRAGKAGKDWEWGRCTTPSEADANLLSAAPDLFEVLKEYEAWEADLILNGDWSDETVRMTQAQLDQMVAIQGKRNAALSKATPITARPPATVQGSDTPSDDAPLAGVPIQDQKS